MGYEWLVVVIDRAGILFILYFKGEKYLEVKNIVDVNYKGYLLIIVKNIENF